MITGEDDVMMAEVAKGHSSRPSPWNTRPASRSSTASVPAVGGRPYVRLDWSHGDSVNSWMAPNP